MPLEPCNTDCRSECPSPFVRTRVHYLVLGGAEITWELADAFADEEPYIYQLQVGLTGNPDADDWENVGLPAVDAWRLVDDQKRVFGMSLWTHYRIQLTTPEGVYYSKPAGIDNTWNRRDWRLAREMLRKEQLRFRYASPRGFILKRKIHGARCPKSIDPLTGDLKISGCATCYDTGLVGGYHSPIPCVYADFINEPVHFQVDPQTRGSVGDVTAKARFIVSPQLFEHDVWVDYETDERWYVHEISSLGDVRARGLIVNVGLRLAQLEDVIYQFPVPRGG